jgi:hypothetical protein
MDPTLLAQTVALIRGELDRPNSELLKAFTQSSVATQGLQAYNLEAPAKNLFPYLVPLVDSIPRRVGGYGSQANWKAITGVNIGALSLGVAEGKRGGVVSTNTAEYYAAYRFLGFDDFVTEQAWRAAVNFQDLRATARLNLLKAVRLWEDGLHLGGNGTAVALGTPTAPTVADDASSGSLSGSTAYDVAVVALTLEALMNIGGMTALGAAVAATKILQTVARANAGPYGGTTTYNGGTSIPSSITSHTTASGKTAVNAYTPVVPGAVAYAWFIGTTGNATLAAITSINSVILSAVGASTQTLASLAATDYSKNALVYDGLLYQAWKPNSGSYIYNMATGTPGVGTPLTADGKGGIQEFTTVFRYLWDHYRIGVDQVWVNAQEAMNITQKLLTGTGATASQSFHFMVPADQSGLVGGMVVDSILNPFDPRGARRVKLMIEPNMPPGTILFEALEIPYPLSNVPVVRELELRFDYIAVDWPKVQWADEFGVYFDGVLKHYFPPAMAVIANAANG